MKYLKFLLLIPALYLAACAATGTPFQRITQIPADKGVIYVYRPNSLIGSAVHYDVHAGETDVLCDLVSVHPETPDSEGRPCPLSG